MWGGSFLPGSYLSLILSAAPVTMLQTFWYLKQAKLINTCEDPGVAPHQKLFVF